MGADVTIIPEHVFNQAYERNNPKLENAKIITFDPVCVPVDFSVTHQKGRKHITEQAPHIPVRQTSY